MQPKGLLDVSVLDRSNTNLKKAISHKTKKNAYTATQTELERLSKDTEIQDAKLKKAFGRIAGLFERSLKFKEHKLTGLNSFPKLNDFCRTIIKSNWHIDLKNATTISDINAKKQKFLEDICETIRNTELHKNGAYEFTRYWIDDISKSDKRLITLIHANNTLKGEKHSKLISEAAAHINKCIEKEQQKCQKLKKTIKSLDHNVNNFTKYIEEHNVLNNPLSKNHDYDNFFEFIQENLGRKSELFPYYKRLSGGKDLVKAVDKLEQNFDKNEEPDNRDVIEEFKKDLADVEFIGKNEDNDFIQEFNKIKQKFASKE